MYFLFINHLLFFILSPLFGLGDFNYPLTVHYPYFSGTCVCTFICVWSRLILPFLKLAIIVIILQIKCSLAAFYNFCFSVDVNFSSLFLYMQDVINYSFFTPQQLKYTFIPKTNVSLIMENSHSQ